jgi:hypothetical protein
LVAESFLGTVRPGIPAVVAERAIGGGSQARARCGATAIGTCQGASSARARRRTSSSDMACPVHVHRVLHDTDGYEWFRRIAYRRAGALPVPAPPRHDGVGARRASRGHTSLPGPDHTARVRSLARAAGSRARSRNARAVPAAIPDARYVAGLLELFVHTVHSRG